MASDDGSGVTTIPEVTIYGSPPETSRPWDPNFQKERDAANQLGYQVGSSGGVGMCYDDPELQAAFDEGYRRGVQEAADHKKALSGQDGPTREIGLPPDNSAWAGPLTSEQAEEGRKTYLEREEQKKGVVEWILGKEDPHGHEEEFEQPESPTNRPDPVMPIPPRPVLE